MILKKNFYWFGTSEKDSVRIYQNDDDSFAVFLTDNKTNKMSVLECNGCNLEECVQTTNRVFNTYYCIEE